MIICPRIPIRIWYRGGGARGLTTDFTHASRPLSTGVIKYTRWLVIVWTAVCGAMLGLNIWQNRQVTMQRATAEARANFNKDQAFRFWAAEHGGVYVPTDSLTRPNEYLAYVSERDIVTPSGRRLTLMNPAYMVRQVNEQFRDLYGVAGHITSLKPLRPENAPNAWETRALKAFEGGTSEFIEFTQLEGQPFLCLMQAMVVTADCMKCHAQQGYTIGDIRGGVGISLPMASHLAEEKRSTSTNAATMALMWLAGCAFIGVSGRNLRRRVGERDAAAAELQATHDLLRLERDIFISGSVVVFKWRNAPGWPVDYVSANVEHVLGHTAADFMEGRVAYASLLHPDDAERVGREVAEWSRQRAHRFEHLPYRLITRRGEERWVLDHTTMCYGDDGEISTYLGYVVDITDLQSTTEALRVSEGRLSLVLEGAELGFWDWHVPSGAVVVNEHWARMLGYDPGEIAPHVSSWENLLHPDDVDAVKLVLNDHLEGRTPFYECEQRLRTRSGAWKWILDRGKVIERDDQGRPVRALGIHQDISERKLAEEKFVRQERLAAVGQLAAGIAHDFNNLLTSVLGNAELMAQSPGLARAEREQVRAISESGRRAAHLVRQILDFSQKAVRRPQAINLATLVGECLSFLRSSLGENIRIEWRAEGAGFHVAGDASQLQQVITNLAVNARHAMPRGGSLRVRLSSAPGGSRAVCAVCGTSIDGDWIRLEVTDTGEGIAPDILPRIFEPFFTTRSVGEGSGLGLSQVSGIVAQHGGHITVESRLGEGTTFAVYLPRAAAGEPAALNPGAGLCRGRGETILLVEDEPGVRIAVQKLLEHLGYRVLTTSNGAEAVVAFGAAAPNISLVLSDMVMPDMDGAALFDRLRAMDPDLKMAIMSGYPLHEDGPALLKRGLLAWVQKPLTLASLSGVLGDALGTGAQQRSDDVPAQ